MPRISHLSAQRILFLKHVQKRTNEYAEGVLERKNALRIKNTIQDLALLKLEIAWCGGRG